MNRHRYKAVSYLHFVAGFADELAQIRRHIGDFTIERYLGQETESNDVNVQCSLILARLKGMLMEQRAFVNEVGNEEEIRWYQTVQYALAAYADEVMLNLVFDEKEWDGKEQWSSNLLERSMFKTDMAGRTLFEWIDRAIRSNDTSPIHREVASVYLVLLRLGFRGRYLPSSNDERIEEYERRLLELIGLPPEGEQTTPIFSEAYDYVRGDSRTAHVAPARRWWRWWLFSAAAYLLISFGVWWWVVWEVRRLALVNGG